MLNINCYKKRDVDWIGEINVDDLRNNLTVILLANNSEMNNLLDKTSLLNTL